MQNPIRVEIDFRHLIGNQQDCHAALCKLTHDIINSLLVADIDSDRWAI